MPLPTAISFSKVGAPHGALEHAAGKAKRWERFTAVIHPYNLVRCRMPRSGQYPRLHRSVVRTHLSDQCRVRTLLLQSRQDLSAGFIPTDGSGDRYAGTQIKQVVGRIGGPARQTDPVPAFQNQHRSLARNPGYLSVEEFVGDQIPYHDDPAFRKSC
ncbi:MAG: hypothetical protein P8Z37_13720 [Acidobacteriota bacterium]